MLPILDSIWEALLRASLYAAILFPVAWTACRILHRLPRRTHCWIWRLVYLKVIIATFWLVPIEIPILPSAVNHLDSISSTTTPATSNTLSTAEFSVASSTPSEQSFHGTHVLVAFWSIGLAVYLVRSYQEWRFGLRIRQNGISVNSGPLLELYQSAASALKIQRPPKLLESDQIDVPALVGILRPSVVVPIGLVNQIDLKELGLILRHELGHQKRLDLSWNLVARFVDLTLYFHPLTWLASRRWKITQEAACDEYVLQSPNAHSRTYANALLHVADRLRQGQSKPFSAISAVSSFRSLRERIIALQSVPTWTKASWTTAVTSTFLASMIGIIPWQLVPQKPEVGFTNGKFETGDTAGWTISTSGNAEYRYGAVTPFDIRQQGNGSESKSFSLAVGQINSEPKVYRNVEITQELSLKKGQTYNFSFDWAVQNFFSIDNFDGGVFELVVDGQSLAKFDTQNILTNTVEHGTLSASFTSSRSGNYSVGARISRRFPIPFPKSQDPIMLQYLDNFQVQKAVKPD